VRSHAGREDSVGPAFEPSVTPPVPETFDKIVPEVSVTAEADFALLSSPLVRRYHLGALRHYEIEGIANLQPLEGLRRHLEYECLARLCHDLHPGSRPIDRREGRAHSAVGAPSLDVYTRLRGHDGFDDLTVVILQHVCDRCPFHCHQPCGGQPWGCLISRAH
jgi:hypothetical protein